MASQSIRRTPRAHRARRIIRSAALGTGSPATVETLEHRQLLSGTPLVRINYLDTIQVGSTNTYENRGHRPAPQTLTWYSGVPLHVTGLDATGADTTTPASGDEDWNDTGYKSVNWSGTLVDGSTGTPQPIGEQTGNTNGDSENSAPVLAKWSWDFGDPDSARYNTLDGFNAAHIFTLAPGQTSRDYTVRLTVTNSTNQSSYSDFTVHVVSNPVETSGTTYFISSDGQASNSGTSAQSPWNAAKLATFLNSQNSGMQNWKILFRKGDTIHVPTALGINQGNVYVGGYFDPARPSSDQPVLVNDTQWDVALTATPSSRNVVIDGLTFQTANGTADDVALKGVNGAVINSTFLSGDHAVYCMQSATGVLVQHNSAPEGNSIGGYFMWVQGSDLVVLDNTVHQGASTMYGIRATGAGDGISTVRAEFALNNLLTTRKQNLRLHQGRYYYVWHNTISGAGMEFGPLSNGAEYRNENYPYNIVEDELDDPVHLTYYVVCDGNLITQTPVLSADGGTWNNVTVQLTVGLEHAVVRNNIITKSDITASQYNADGPVIDILGILSWKDPIDGTTFGDRRVRDAYILNNTVINNIRDAKGPFVSFKANTLSDPSTGSPFTITPEITLANNLFVAGGSLNLSSGNGFLQYAYNSGGSPLDEIMSVSGNVWPDPGTSAPMHVGSMRYGLADWNNFPVVGTDAFSTVTLDSEYRPQSVAADVAAPYGGVFEDYHGNPRPASAPWTAGAVQRNASVTPPRRPASPRRPIRLARSPSPGRTPERSR